MNTIRQPSQGVFKDKGSKFLSFAFPVKDEDEVKNIVVRLKKQYFDARHHCYAYILGQNGEKFRTNDDGEPSGTAGKPIYGQLLSKNLTNTLIVVVRYFGGTLLGTSGLINAYKHAALDALDNAAIIEAIFFEEKEIRFQYEEANEVLNNLRKINAEILEQHFDNECIVKYRIITPPQSNFPK
ncbi:hypothetical protein FACS1894178_8850 [Bacteroidia bacterium]|nr:hypothetical protein FACS1894178_8850 [Bacteroidia bacterium]